jgi:hypothetical protein
MKGTFISRSVIDGVVAGLLFASVNLPDRTPISPELQK